MQTNVCYMTRTRLMGVLAGYIDYQFDGSRIVEFYHIEIEEYGIDRFEQLLLPDDHAVKQMRLEMLGRLGGEIVMLTEAEFGQVVAYGMAINRKSKSLLKALEKSHWLIEMPSANLDIFSAAINKLIEKVVSKNGFIHYFLMRYFAQDNIYHYMIKNDLEKSEHYYSVLLNQLTERTDGYHFSALLLGESYAMATGIVTLSEERVENMRDLEIVDLSDYDAAALLRQQERVIVYTIEDENLEHHLLQENKQLATTLYPCGRLYIKYRPDDRHVNQALFRLSDDVEVYIYITDGNQLLLSSSHLSQLELWDKRLTKRFGSALRRHAAFQFDTSILYDFILSNQIDFENYLEQGGE